MGFNEFMTKLFGNKSQRDLKEITPYVDKIKAVYPSIQKLSNDELRAKTDEIKQRIQDYVADERAKVEELRKGIDNKELEEREAIWAEVDKIEKNITEKMEVVHYDVQLFGGVVLHKGKIAEMATGEGKTLVATLPVFLNALTRNGVHVVTVNDYLSKRDSEWMGPLYICLLYTSDAADE